MLHIHIIVLYWQVRCLEQGTDLYKELWETCCGFSHGAHVSPQHTRLTLHWKGSEGAPPRSRPILVRGGVLIEEANIGHVENHRHVGTRLSIFVHVFCEERERERVSGYTKYGNQSRYDASMCCVYWSSHTHIMTLTLPLTYVDLTALEWCGMVKFLIWLLRGPSQQCWWTPCCYGKAGNSARGKLIAGMLYPKGNLLATCVLPFTFARHPRVTDVPGIQLCQTVGLATPHFTM